MALSSFSMIWEIPLSRLIWGRETETPLQAVSLRTYTLSAWEWYVIVLCNMLASQRAHYEHIISFLKEYKLPASTSYSPPKKSSIFLMVTWCVSGKTSMLRVALICYVSLSSPSHPLSEVASHFIPLSQRQCSWQEQTESQPTKQSRI